jgi:hypothetical protein
MCTADELGLKLRKLLCLPQRPGCAAEVSTLGLSCSEFEEWRKLLGPQARELLKRPDSIFAGTYRHLGIAKQFEQSRLLWVCSYRFLSNSESCLRVELAQVVVHQRGVWGL